MLATAASWLAWLPYVLSENGLGLWVYRFPEFLGTSQLAGVLPGAYLGPIASAFVVTLVADGRAGVRQWAGRLWRWRVSWRWYAVALLGVPAAMLITGAAFSGGSVQAPGMAVLVAYVPLLLLQMITAGLAEEPGWRDFALPRMQRALGPLRASLLLGVLWAIWHLPLFLTDWGGWPDASWTRPVAFIGFCIAFSVVMTWLFNRSGESLPLVLLAHVSVNTFATLVWSSLFPALSDDATMPAMFAGAAVAAGLVIALTRGRLGYAAPSAAVASRRGDV